MPDAWYVLAKAVMNWYIPGAEPDPKAFLDADRIIAALRAAGLAVVPVEPTAEMVIAGRDADPRIEAEAHGQGPVPLVSDIRAIYAAMLAAAPKP